MKRTVLLGLACAGVLAWALGASAVEMPLSDTFRRLKAPETGRAVVQLTDGEGST